MLTFADGTTTDMARTLPLPSDIQDWFTVGIPLSKLGLPSGSSPALTSLVVSTDCPTFINVGKIRVVTDNTPIVASTGGEKDISVNDEAVFNAEVTAGASTLNYQWDFDTKGAFVAQADGARATHTYTTPGAYKVTLIVTDVDGIKTPVTTTSMVHVEQ
jgi:PKD repeat protein